MISHRNNKRGGGVHSGPAAELAADEAHVPSLAGASAEEWTAA
ncbi:MAG: hypothetical protein ACLPKB_02265 [Xanthobacteraceae bacterium]